MEHTFVYYIVCLLAIIVGIFLVKKITGCLVKTVILLVLLAALAAVYFLYLE